MATTVVRYQPRPGAADDNQALVEAVFAELAASRPQGLRYATFRLGDGTFVHLAEVDGEENPLFESAAFAAFQEGLAERCGPGHGPNPQPATLIGNYGMIS
jgi:hypothetical protein